MSDFLMNIFARLIGLLTSCKQSQISIRGKLKKFQCNVTKEMVSLQSETIKLWMPLETRLSCLATFQVHLKFDNCTPRAYHFSIVTVRNICFYLSEALSNLIGSVRMACMSCVMQRVRTNKTE